MPKQILIILAALLVGSTIGAPVATWKAEAGFSVEREALRGRQVELVQQVAELEKAIGEQNKANALVAEKLNVALAERLAADLAGLSKSRLAKLEQTVTHSCSDVLKRYWELRQ